jgi:hypothetical protein
MDGVWLMVILLFLFCVEHDAQLIGEDLEQRDGSSLAPMRVRWHRPRRLISSESSSRVGGESPDVGEAVPPRQL